MAFTSSKSPREEDALATTELDDNAINRAYVERMVMGVVAMPEKGWFIAMWRRQGDPEPIGLHVMTSTDEIRRVAQLMLEAADELDGIGGRPS